MYLINFSKTIPHLSKMAQEYNQDHILGRSKNGNPRHDLKAILREPHQNLLGKMVVLYGHQLLNFKLIRVGKDLPPFRTNSPALAKALGCSERSIRNYLSRLIAAGFITGKKGKGRNRNYALTFRSDLLILNLKAQREENERLLEQADNEAFAKELRQSLPPLYPGTINKEKQVPWETAPGICERLANPGNLPGNPRSKMREIEGQNPENEKEKGAAARPEIAQETRSKIALDGGEVVAPSPIPNLSVIMEYVLRLFSLVVSTLYQDTPPKRSQAYYIKLFFAQEFANLSLEQFRERYTQLGIRIMLVQKYLRKNPKRFIPPPQKYFDRNFEHGFVATEEWYQNMMHRTREIEKHERSSRLMLKAWGGFCQVWQKYLPEGNLHAYGQGRSELETKYPQLLEVYDYLFVDLVQPRTPTP
ncbi:MAG: SgrR family transcriptional regulator [Bacteroidia bacterium]|nr:SgrR family transcriptional regulator [Bacteroidia bacterium]